MKRDLFLIILLLIVLTGWVGSVTSPNQSTKKASVEATQKTKIQSEKNDSPWSVLGIY